MMRYVFLFLMMLFCFSGQAQQQDLQITGTVTDGSGMPLPGVNIIVKGTTNGVSTDFDGLYSIRLSSGSTLVFSYIGFNEQEIQIDEEQELNVSLESNTDALEEVVVIGYGAQKRKEITGAVSTVSSETLAELKPIKVEQALQGTVSGVNVTTQSGAPGANLDIRIRGISTNGQNAPLVIIDGYQSELGLLNPNDIETITVLKDAQAAIYGTIGANGVILITTKKGRKNQAPQVSYNVYTGFQETTRKLPLLDATEYGILLNEAYANGGRALPLPNVAALGNGTDWQEAVFDDAAPLVNHDFNISGGSENITYSASGSHLFQQGIVGGKKSSFRRNTARISLGVDLSDKIKLQTNAIYTYFDRDTFNENGLGSVLFNALNTPPTLPIRDDNGDYSLVPNTAGLGIEIINPLAQLENTYNDFDFNKLNGNVSLDYDVVDQVQITGRIGFNTSNSEGKSFAKQISYGGKVFDVQRSSVSQQRVNDNSYTLDIFATYEDTFAENHKVTFTGGTTVYKEWGDGLSGTGYDVPNNSWDFADIALAIGTSEEGVRDVGSYAYDERRLSFFGRLQYNFSDKYLFSAILRRDLSTKFGPGNQVGYFPSVTAGYVVSDESFFPDSETLNFLKFRASYGILGNDQIGNNGYVGTLSGEATYVLDGVVVNGRAIGVLPNPNLQWEEA
ncbi:MAG: SusC/RagA family TonB-linked outer membrane protein, partial [Leeuwenhoekiella sp.]